MPIDKRHFVVFDLETTGLDPTQKAEIVQIAATTINFNTLEPNNNGEFQIILKPQFPEAASPEAIKVIGEELWEKAKVDGIHPKVGLRKFIDYVNSANWQNKFYTAPILTGYNSVKFDEPFLIHWLTHYKLVKDRNSLPWSNQSKDLMFQMHDLFHLDDLPNRKLDTHLNLFNLSRSSATHDALEDVRLTAQLFVRYMKMMRHIRSKLKIEQTAHA